jgi:hypothetical protein
VSYLARRNLGRINRRLAGLGDDYEFEWWDPLTWAFTWPTEASSEASGVASIQSVPANAAAANAAAGTNVYNIPAIQAAADANTSQYIGENAQIWSTAGSTSPLSMPWWAWALGAAVIVLALEKR